MISGDYTQPGYNPEEHGWMKATLGDKSIGDGGYPHG